jgi:hypothetical protein
MIHKSFSSATVFCDWRLKLRRHASAYSTSDSCTSPAFMEWDHVIYGWNCFNQLPAWVRNTPVAAPSSPSSRYEFPGYSCNQLWRVTISWRSYYVLRHAVAMRQSTHGDVFSCWRDKRPVRFFLKCWLATRRLFIAHVLRPLLVSERKTGIRQWASFDERRDKKDTWIGAELFSLMLYISLRTRLVQVDMWSACMRCYCQLSCKLANDHYWGVINARWDRGVVPIVFVPGK